MAKSQIPEVVELENLLREISTLSNTDRPTRPTPTALPSPQETTTTISHGLEATLNDLNTLVESFDKMGAAARRPLQKKPIPRSTQEKPMITGAAEGDLFENKINYICFFNT
jgi:hypothetical protein